MSHSAPSQTEVEDEASILSHAKTSTGQTLAELSREKPVLLVMLRHAGCTFCRNAMSDISRLRRRIEKDGTQIVLGHMGTVEDFQAFATRYGLQDLPAIADPDRRVYRGLGLKRGTLLQLLGPRVWWRGLLALLSGHGLGGIKGDVGQMPGTFLLHRGKVVVRFEARDSADKPDYMGMLAVAGA